MRMRKRVMISEIDLLRADIPRLEQKFGVGDPFVGVLKAQLALLQNERRLQPRQERYHRWLVNLKRFQIRKSNERSDDERFKK
jgi:hypothetical protein